MESNTKKVTSVWAKVLIYVALSLGAIIMLFPFIFMILTSLKTYSESIAVPPKLLPNVAQFENYKIAMEMAPFDIYFKNTVISACWKYSFNIICYDLCSFCIYSL